MNSAFKGLIFGTAGIPLSTSPASTLHALDRLKELGLSCLEVELVRGFRFSRETAMAIRRRAEELGIILSAHAPYSINFLSAEPGKRLSSQEQLLSSARLAELCGIRNLVFHGGFYGTNPPDKALEILSETLKNIISILRSEKNRVILRLETMGKKSQFGTLEEILSLCQEIEELQPCLDFSHLYAREGELNGYQQFSRVLNKVAKKLGEDVLHDLHLHISGIEFGEKGEIKHLNLKEADLRWEEWIMALHDRGVAGRVICESPSLEADALCLQNLYLAYKEKSKKFF
ncbi:MAG: TIM barrel protein [Candidatus Aminicenantes bacterium]|nr:TIM barrel protein [Candidatus Aminicenantes bacterium]